MTTAKRDARRRQIEDAAYTLLADKGFAGTSMLSVAKLAKCSNETLYNWYGDKVGLFRDLVARNAEEARTLLQDALAAPRPLAATLRDFGPLLLHILLSDRAIALNRAAAADATGTLGQALAEAGRDTIRTLLQSLFLQDPAVQDPDAACELYLTLLIGDLQIRRVIGRLAEPDDAFRIARAETALSHCLRLIAADEPGSRAT